jgi:O-acetyl-ADP-ribose deacetylase (regulator of RNase III)
VDGAIHRAAGPELLIECRGLIGCKPGEMKLTKGYKLKAKFIFHTVGPIWRGGDNMEEQTLSSCYRVCMYKAIELGLSSIAFPSISTGVYGFPKSRAARIAFNTICEVLGERRDLDVYIVCFGHQAFREYRHLLDSCNDRVQ